MSFYNYINIVNRKKRKEKKGFTPVIHKRFSNRFVRIIQKNRFSRKNDSLAFTSVPQHQQHSPRTLQRAPYCCSGLINSEICLYSGVLKSIFFFLNS